MTAVTAQPALEVEPVLTALARRTGVEVELLAPPGSDRRALAEAVARRAGGSVRRTSTPTPSRPWCRAWATSGT